MAAMCRALSAGVLVLLLALMPARGQAQRYSPGPYHPMDALTIDEVLAAVRLVREAGHTDDATRYPVVTLKEMPKAAVRTWRRGQPFSRSALVVMRKPGVTSEAVVDLTGKRVVSYREVPGAQPSVMNGEWREAQRLTKASPAWQAAMRARGFEDFSGIFCGPMPAGRFPGDGGGSRRFLKVPCYDNRADSGNPHGQPIEGVLALVDVDAGMVVEVIDSGVVGTPDKSGGQPAAGAKRAALKPVVNASPDGSNFQIRGNFEVTWQNWSFHVRGDRRFGSVLSLVRYNDGGRERDIAYQMALSELFVPYMDSDPQWGFRTPLDVGEFGLGYLASPLTPGADCPQQSAFLDLVMPSDTGELFKVERGMCIFERSTGDPAWRHAPAGADVADSRRAVELVVRTIPTIGNYDYAVDWIFALNGNIRIRVGATGFDAVKGVATATMTDPSAAADTRYGTLLAPYTVAVNHDHFFSFRIDLDVDGPDNTLVHDMLMKQRLAGDGGRRSLWRVKPEPVKREGALSRGHDGLYRLANPGTATSLGHRPSFHILPGHGVASLLDPDDPAQARAAFSTERLWLSRYKPDELYSAGPYPNQSEGGDGLPRYVADGEATTGADVVLWYTMGFHHVTRTEDWPVMPTMWHALTLRPFNFFDRNPSADLP